MRHDGHFNHQYLPTPRVPAGTGDRFWAQDMARDFQYLRGLPGELVADLLALGSALLAGGVVTEGASKALINVSATVGLCSLDVEVPDDAQPWSVPAPVATRQVRVRASCPALTGLSLAALGATLDGTTVNYVKLRHVELTAQSRVRQYSTGAYPYAKSDSYALSCSPAEPTDYDVVLAELIGDGSTLLSISQYDPTRVGAGIVDVGTDTLGDYYLFGNGARLREGAGIVATGTDSQGKYYELFDGEMLRLSSGGGMVKKILEVTTSQSWTCPANVFMVDALLVGGGGGGGGSINTRGGTGAGAGGVTRRKVPVVPGTVYSLVIGAGGTGGAAGANGGTGGATTAFGLSAFGGGYGYYQGTSILSSGGSAGAGGSASGSVAGAKGIIGNAGFHGTVSTSTQIASGAGVSSVGGVGSSSVLAGLGVKKEILSGFIETVDVLAEDASTSGTAYGGAGGSCLGYGGAKAETTAGNPGVGYGSGGGGAALTSKVGGAGKQGLIIFSWEEPI